MVNTFNPIWNSVLEMEKKFYSCKDEYCAISHQRTTFSILLHSRGLSLILTFLCYACCQNNRNGIKSLTRRVESNILWILWHHIIIINAIQYHIWLLALFVHSDYVSQPKIIEMWVIIFFVIFSPTFWRKKTISSALQCLLTRHQLICAYVKIQISKSKHNVKNTRWDYSVNCHRFGHSTIFCLDRLAFRHQISTISIDGAIVWQRISSTIKRITSPWEFCSLCCSYCSIHGKQFWDWQPSVCFAQHSLSSIQARCKDNRSGSNSLAQRDGSIWLPSARPHTSSCICSNRWCSLAWLYCCHSVWHSSTHRSDWETWRINCRMRSMNDCATHPWVYFWRRWALASKRWRSRIAKQFAHDEDVTNRSLTFLVFRSSFVLLLSIRISCDMWHSTNSIVFVIYIVRLTHLHIK